MRRRALAGTGDQAIEPVSSRIAAREQQSEREHGRERGKHAGRRDQDGGNHEGGRERAE